MTCWPFLFWDDFEIACYVSFCQMVSRLLLWASRKSSSYLLDSLSGSDEKSWAPSLSFHLLEEIFLISNLLVSWRRSPRSFPTQDSIFIHVHHLCGNLFTYNVLVSRSMTSRRLSTRWQKSKNFLFNKEKHQLGRVQFLTMPSSKKPSVQSLHANVHVRVQDFFLDFIFCLPCHCPRRCEMPVSKTLWVESFP